MREPSRERARGRWAGILGEYLDERALSGKHTSCPMCGGKDRFRLDNKDGAGTWICSHCGAGDGFHLLQALTGMTFADAARHVDNVSGRIQPQEVKQTTDPDRARAALQRVWSEAKPVVEGDPVWLYLRARCPVVEVPANVRTHHALPYRHEDGSATRHPAMVARVQDEEGQPVCLHRTYLTADGKKAAVETVKKLMTPTKRLANVAVRLAPPADGWLGVAEGIETALCASKRFGAPVWALVCAGMMESFKPPAGVKALYVFGDNDESFVGQAAAYRLAKTAAATGIECVVHIPIRPGTDWADEMGNQ
jgi:putative DNA primase/helicase